MRKVAAAAQLINAFCPGLYLFKSKEPLPLEEQEYLYLIMPIPTCFSLMQQKMVGIYLDPEIF